MIKKLLGNFGKIFATALTVSLISATVVAAPANATPVYASSDALSSSRVALSSELTNNTVTVPENVSSLVIDGSYFLGSDFFSANVGKKITFDFKLTGPDGNLVASTSSLQWNYNPYFTFCEANYANCTTNTEPGVKELTVGANKTNGSAGFYAELYGSPNSSGVVAKLLAGTYTLQVKLLADGNEVAVDNQPNGVSINRKVARYELDLRSSNGSYTAASGLSQIGFYVGACVDASKIQVGDVVTPKMYVNDTEVTNNGWNTWYETRSNDTNQTRQMQGSSGATATVIQTDIDYGLAVNTSDYRSNPVAGTSYSVKIAVTNQNGTDVTGSCQPGAGGKPALALSNSTLTATLTVGPKFAESVKCLFYLTTDLTTPVGSSYAYSPTQGATKTCSLNGATPSKTYVVKSQGAYNDILGELSPASDPVLIPAPGISVSPAVSGVTDVGGKASVVSTSIDTFTSANSHRVVADAFGGTYRLSTFMQPVSCPPNCGQIPTTNFKLRQTTASGYVSGFGGTGTISWTPAAGGSFATVAWYGAGEKWTLAATTQTLNPPSTQLELLQGTNSSATTTSTVVAQSVIETTCKSLGADWTSTSSPVATTISISPVSAATSKQLFQLVCFKPTTMSDNSVAYLPSPVLVTIDNSTTITVVKFLGENSANVNSVATSLTASTSASAGEPVLTVFVTKRLLTASNGPIVAGTVTGREIVRIKSDLTSTTQTAAWDPGTTNVTQEPGLLVPAVAGSSFFVVQRAGLVYKLAPVNATGGIGSFVTITNDKATDMPNASWLIPLGAQQGNLSAISLIATTPTSSAVVSVNTSTGAGTAGEIVRYVSSGSGIVSTYVLEASTKDVNWWFSDAAAATDKMSIYKWRNPLYVKPTGPVPTKTSSNLEYSLNSPNGTLLITMNGTNMDLITGVKFGTVAATLGNKRASVVEIYVPNGETGTVNIILESANGNGDGGTFTYVGTSKVSQSLTISAGANFARVGDASRAVSVTGEVAGGYVLTNPTTITSTTNTVCTITGDNTLKFIGKGTCIVHAYREGHVWALDGNADFNITVAGPVPTVTTGASGKATNTPEAGTKVTILGTNLSDVGTVKFGSVAGTIGTRSETSLEVSVPNGTKGVVDVTAFYSNGGTMAAGSFEYVGASKVAQTVSLNAGASTASVGAADRTLTASVSMTGYTAVAALTYSSSTTSVCTVSGATLKFVAKGTCTVKATQAASGWAAEGVDTKSITVLGPVPGVSAQVTGKATNTPDAGTKMVIAGTNLGEVDSVKFGAVTATIGARSATSLEVTVPAGSKGTVDIILAYSGGSVVAGSFEYVGASKVAQTVSLNAGASTATVGDADRTLAATVSMTGYTAVASLSYSSTTPSVCTVTGTSLKFVAKGTCTVKATQAASGWAAEGVDTKSITVAGPDAQTITVISPSAGEKLIGPDGFFVYASTTSGLALSYKVTTPSICAKGTFAANHFVNLKIGTCKITVSAPGNSSWIASSVTLTYTVGKAGTTKITDAGNVNAPVAIASNGSKVNVLSEVVSWKKSTGTLISSSRGVWIGPIKATATFTVDSKKYSCSVSFGTKKAVSAGQAKSVKGFPAPAFCSGTSAADKSALAALKKMSSDTLVKIVVERELHNPTSYATKGQAIVRSVYVTIGG